MSKYELVFLFFIIFFIQKSKNDNYILPLHSINVIDNESILNQDYLSRIYTTHLYTNFIIGSNKEEIKALINMTQIGFFIYENAYNYNSSSSFKQEYKIKSFYKKDYEEGYLSNDTLCLIPYINKIDINNINIKNCNNFDKVNFSLLKSEQKNMEINIYKKYGIIGLQENDNQDEYIMPLFIKSLKNTDMINSHTFSFHFINNTKTGENEGYILLGDEEFDEDNGILKRTISNPKNGQIYWNLIFKNVIIGIDNNNDNNLKKFQIKDAQLIANMPYIIGVNEYKNYMRAYFFEDLLSKDICIFKNVLIDEDYGTYVCDSKSELFIEKYNNQFPKLYFEHDDLNKTFILDQYDLFTYNHINKSDKNIYFLVFFPNKNQPYINPEFPGRAPIIRWKLGIPFLKKYKLTFNADNRIINYYEIFNKNNNDNTGNNDNTNNNSHNNGNNNKDINSNDINNNINLTKIIVIISLVFIFIILGVVLGIYLYKNIIKSPRKKKANELEDDYEYTINPNTLDSQKASLNNYEVSN